CAPVPVSAVKVWRILSKGSHYSWFSYDAQDEDAPPYALEWHRSMGHRSALGVPLTVGNEVLGFISLFFDHASPPPQERIELARVFGQQAVAALQWARLGEQAREAAVAREREQAAREREQAARDRAAALESEVLQRRRAEEVVRAHATLTTNALLSITRDPTPRAFIAQVLKTMVERLHGASGTCALPGPEPGTVVAYLHYHEAP